MNIALIAHDQKKMELIDFVKDNEELCCLKENKELEDQKNA